MTVYLIVCNESLKIYVGQHKGSDLGKYLSRKFYDAKRATGTRSHIYAALRKYPRDSWSIWPLVSNITTQKELNELEKHYIRVLRAQHPDIGYNICDGGQPNPQIARRYETPEECEQRKATRIARNLQTRLDRKERERVQKQENRILTAIWKSILLNADIQYVDW